MAPTRVIDLSPETAYATKDNILYPGTPAQAAAAEQKARDRLAGQIGTAANGTFASLTTKNGSNKDFVLLARTPGLAGNDVTLTVVDPATQNASLSVSVAGSDITVSLETNSSSNEVSTAEEVVDAINADTDARELVVAELAPSQTGAGVVPALAKTNLAGGSATNPNPSTNIVMQEINITPAP